MPSDSVTSRIRATFAGFKRGALTRAIRLFRLPEGSERVARGFSIGLVVNFFPTFGFGVVVSGFIARILGGNTIAGVIGGATLAAFWPLLFYINIRVGEIFHLAPIQIDELDDVTESTVDALVWGKTFMVGATLNSLVVGLLSYAVIYVVHARLRPRALGFFRRLAARIRNNRSFRTPARLTGRARRDRKETDVRG